MNTPQKKTRNRRPVSCWPCRERKVRCDRKSPCATCTRRGHVHKCQIESPSHSSAGEDSPPQYGLPAPTLPTPRLPDILGRSPHSLSGGSLSGVSLSGVSTVPTPAAFTSVSCDDASIIGSRAVGDVDEPERMALLDGIAKRLEPTHNTDETTREKVYLGQNCAANFFRALNDHATLRKLPQLPSHISIESAFGLTNRTTLHPFGSLWSYAGDVSLRNILQSLPAVEVCLRYYRNFNQNVLPFYPFLLNAEVFETRFCDFLQTLGDAGLKTALELAAGEGSFQDAAWYGVLFGVLACGCQFHEAEAASDRILRARVFVAGAFECLRLANLFGMPSEATIQALLMIELTIANDANPGMAWSLLGTTAQNAQSIGLHLNINKSPEWDAAIHPLWSAIWFLDSSLSLAFDRRPSSFAAGIDRRNIHVVGGSRYPTFCSWTGAIHKLKLAWQLEQLDDARAGNVPPPRIVEYLTSLTNLESIPPYGERSGTKPSTIHRRIEQLVSLIHINHFKAEVLRSAALSSTFPSIYRDAHFADMMRSLNSVITAYCTLKPLSATMANSWPMLYATISAALLVAGINFALRMHIPPVVGKLIEVLSEVDDVGEGDDDGMRIGRTAYADSLEVLRRLYENSAFEED